MRLLDPKLDVVFKLLFSQERNRRLLASLLTAVLEPDEPITDITVQNPEIPKLAALDKGVVLDMRVRLGESHQINVEMQSRNEASFQKRALFYWARLYTSQLARGSGYDELLPTVSVIVQNFTTLPTERYRSRFRLLEMEEHWPLTGDLTFHVLELPKLPRAPSPAAPLALWKWAKFFTATTPADLEQLAMNDPVFDEAKRALEELSADPVARELARERELWAYNYETELRHARKQGERALLRQQLALKFGELPPPFSARLDAASEPELARWAERILTANALDEVFA